MSTGGGGSIDKLVEVMAQLRSDQGCPWDREQTHQTLKQFLLEESYEVLEAIDAGDDAELCKELGDVLLQVVFHAQIANEEGRFNVDDVCIAILKAIERKNEDIEIFNIGSGKIVSIGAVAEKIYRFWGKKIPDEVKTGRRGNYLCANLDSVKTHLEWEPKVSLEEGLRIMAIEYGKKR